MRIPTLLVLPAVALAALGCSASRSRSRVLDDAPGSWLALERPQEPEKQEKPKTQEKEEEPPREGRSAGHVILLYIPNRLLDIFDIARFGVNAGPGVGADVEATEYLRAAAMSRISAGVGYETLRHLPVMAGAESELALGPVGTTAAIPYTWYRNTWDVRVELHVLIVGAHVAVNPAEILDAILGFTTIDIMDDDY